VTATKSDDVIGLLGPFNHDRIGNRTVSWRQQRESYVKFAVRSNKQQLSVSYSKIWADGEDAGNEVKVDFMGMKVCKLQGFWKSQEYLENSQVHYSNEEGLEENVQHSVPDVAIPILIDSRQ
jgi:hypothetical protein